MSRRIIQFWVHGLPWLMIPAVAWGCLSWSGDALFTAYVLGLPCVYGYVGPGIATHLLKKWRFTGAGVVGAYYWHHGFLYAANMSPWFVLSCVGLPLSPWGGLAVVRVLVTTALLHGFVHWVHDLLLVRHGMVQIFNRPAREGRSPEEIVTHYAPLCFSLIGLCYAASACLAFQVFVVQGRHDAVAIAEMAAVGLGLLLTIPSLAYRALE